MAQIFVTPSINNTIPIQGVDTNIFVEGDFTANFNTTEISDYSGYNPTPNLSPYILTNNQSLIISSQISLGQVCKLIKIFDLVTGDTNFLTLIKEYRYSYDRLSWSSWTNFNDIPMSLNSLDDFYIEFKYTCILTNSYSTSGNELPQNYNPEIQLRNIYVQGNLELQRTKFVATLTKPGQCVIICPEDTWKVWNLSSFKIISSSLNNNLSLNSTFRVSTSSGRTWTSWLPLTNHNLQALKFDPLRFFMLEISLCRAGSDTTTPIKVWDIEFNGDFQNVSEDYKKYNRFGLRTDCRTSYDQEECAPGAVQYPPVEWLNAGECADGCNTGTFNPYDQSILPLYNHLSNQISNIFGWEVDYYKTDPDRNGTDMVLHEYSLLNVVALKKVKVLVEKNKFPENTILANQFDLELFDTFQVHLTRDEFKKAFGLIERPAKWDFLFFCEWNRLYQITHSVANKDFMNSSVYYVLTLKKAQNNQHVRTNDPNANNNIQIGNQVKTIEQTIDELTNNSSLDSLFGETVKLDTLKVADKPQLQSLAHDTNIRTLINSNVRNVEYVLQNGSNNVITKNYYDISNVSNTTEALKYSASIDSTLDSAEDRTFIIWFNLKTKRNNTQYNILSHQQIINGTPTGYKFSYQDNRFDLEWGTQFLEVSAPMVEINIWYCLVIRIHQSAEKWQLKLYRRQSDINPNSYSATNLKNVLIDQGNLIPITYNLTNSISIFGSEMKITNLRIFNSLITEDSIQSILNQYIINDSSYLLLADNMQPQYSLDNISYRTNDRI